jgi:hypothetical protein
MELYKLFVKVTRPEKVLIPDSCFLRMCEINFVCDTMNRITTICTKFR